MRAIIRGPWNYSDGITYYLRELGGIHHSQLVYAIHGTTYTGAITMIMQQIQLKLNKNKIINLKDFEQKHLITEIY